MAVIVRFAPSPTGMLHVGNLRTALVNWLFARRHGGRFLLRLDDTDVERSRQEFANAILADLSWMGLTWDLFARQSDRLDAYAAAVQHLKATGRLYPCYETTEELDLRRAAAAAAGRPPVYDRAALHLTPGEVRAFEAEGRRPHWRFRLEDRLVTWPDMVRGVQSFPPGTVSDPVLIRADGRPLYTLTSVVDDCEFGITHVIRGEDHVTNTAVQNDLFAALGHQPPVFAHLPLMVGADGHALSKRLGSLTVASLARRGLEPMAVASCLARLGSADPVEPQGELAALAAGFELTRISRNPPRFDEAELDRLNPKVLARTSFEAITDRLAAAGAVGAGPDFWLAIRGNINFLGDCADWWNVLNGTISSPAVDQELVTKALALMPPEPWDTATWRGWTAAVSAATGLKGKAVYLPLRLVVTGREQGPDLATILPMIGRTNVRERLIAAGADDLALAGP